MTRFERAKAADDVSAATSIREESVRALGAPGVPGSTAKTLRRLLRNLHKWIGSHEAGDVLAGGWTPNHPRMSPAKAGGPTR
ncbi:hypothetical protein ACFV6D_30645, partial [Kitasatospora sp. NPDC059812]|uniref:hypothetical protein n=1 Tax=Kitasatospora sp. NPDC059812 TaxID=3346958 RepID=UPI003653C806